MPSTCTQHPRIPNAAPLACPSCRRERRCVPPLARRAGFVAVLREVSSPRRGRHPYSYSTIPSARSRRRSAACRYRPPCSWRASCGGRGRSSRWRGQRRGRRAAIAPSY
eukprot:scaffold213217_cov27-Tisochrysis_lutea.AAC.3